LNPKFAKFQKYYTYLITKNLFSDNDVIFDKNQCISANHLQIQQSVHGVATLTNLRLVGNFLNLFIGFTVQFLNFYADLKKFKVTVEML
jgi:hypothetical protein